MRCVAQPRQHITANHYEIVRIVRQANARGCAIIVNSTMATILVADDNRANRARLPRCSKAPATTSCARSTGVKRSRARGAPELVISDAHAGNGRL